MKTTKMLPKKVKTAKEPRYLNKDDVFMRLHDSLVKYSGVPYLAIADEKNIVLRSLVTKTNLFSVDANSPLLDISSIEIGYINYSAGKVFYVSRMPLRKQKQGTSYINCVCYSLGSRDMEIVSKELIYSKSVHDAIRGVYPEYKEALQSIRDGLRSAVAISRNIALGTGPSGEKGVINIYFEQELIGEINSEDEAVLLPSYNDSVVVMSLANLGIGTY